MRELAVRSIVLSMSLIHAAPHAHAQVASAPTVAELLARNLDARGGAERWAAVRTLEMKGRYDAWSAPQPFTILRARPDRYRFDHAVFTTPCTLAWDGSGAWLRSAVFEAPDGAPLEENWKRNVQEDSAFMSRLQTLAALGVPFELVGKADVDGTPAWQLRALPADAPAETWYLDASTGLEIKRESTTFDVFSGAIEMGMETFYTDFRDVQGLKLPFREERHFGTRYHVWVLDGVRVNPTLDDAVFVLPVKAEEPPAPASP